jgi:hypothetical protein
VRWRIRSSAHETDHQRFISIELEKIASRGPRENERQGYIDLFSQTDSRTARLNPVATSLQLHLLLREVCFGVRDFPPAVHAVSFLSCSTGQTSALSSAVSHPSSAPACAASASWHFLHAQFPELCPSLAKGFTAVTAAQHPGIAPATLGALPGVAGALQSQDSSAGPPLPATAQHPPARPYQSKPKAHIVWGPDLPQRPSHTSPQCNEAPAA